jgi:polyisoprenoid-binding protein YceI
MRFGIAFVAAPGIRPRGARNAAHALFQQPARMSGSRTARAGAVARAVGLAFALAWSAAGRLFGQDAPTEWRIIPAESRLTVTVFPAGLLASALHTHHFRPADWAGEISWDPARPGLVRIAVRVAADSLRDEQPELSAKDVAKVERQARGPEILDAPRFPKILFEAGRLDRAQIPPNGQGEFRATLAGTLTLHGQSRPVELPIQGRVAGARLEASGTVTFRQSDFGIKPYRTALGTVAVKDEVTVDIALVASGARS